MLRRRDGRVARRVRQVDAHGRGRRSQTSRSQRSAKAPIRKAVRGEPRRFQGSHCAPQREDCVTSGTLSCSRRASVRSCVKAGMASAMATHRTDIADVALTAVISAYYNAVHRNGRPSQRSAHLSGEQVISKEIRKINRQVRCCETEISSPLYHFPVGRLA